MATIEEIEEKLNVGINLANDIQKFVQEQDRIARQEERERCIKAAQDYICGACPVHIDCTINGDDGEYQNHRGAVKCECREIIRKAMEGGEV